MFALWSSSTATMQYSIPFSCNEGLRRKKLLLEISKTGIPTVNLILSPCAMLKLVLILSSSIKVLHADDIFEDVEDLSTNMAPSAFEIVPEDKSSKSSLAYQTKYDNYFVAITTFNPDDRARNNFSYKLGSPKATIKLSSGLNNNNKFRAEQEKPLALAINVSSLDLEKIQNSPSNSLQDHTSPYNTTISSSKPISEAAFKGM